METNELILEFLDSVFFFKYAVCQSHTGHMTGLWFLPTQPLGPNTNEWMNELSTPQDLWRILNLYHCYCQDQCQEARIHSKFLKPFNCYKDKNKMFLLPGPLLMESLLSSLLLSSGSLLTAGGLRAPVLCFAIWGRRRSNSEKACIKNTIISIVHIHEIKQKNAYH